MEHVKTYPMPMQAAPRALVAAPCGRPQPPFIPAQRCMATHHSQQEGYFFAPKQTNPGSTLSRAPRMHAWIARTHLNFSSLFCRSSRSTSSAF